MTAGSAATGPVPFRSARARTGWTLPGGARLAVWVVPNVEFFPLDRPVPGGTGAAHDTLAFAVRDYGARVGFFRVLDALTEVGVRGTAAVNASVVEAYPELVAAMREASWDVMGHSWTNARRLDQLSEQEEREEIARVTDTLGAAFGARPAGWLGAGLAERSTTEARLVENGYNYVADWATDDRPDLTRSGLVTVPYTLEVNDKPAFDQRLLTPEQFADLAIRTFEVLHREGAQEPRVMAIALHPYLIGVPHRIDALRRLLGHIRDHDDVWWTDGATLARHYRKETQR
ncbi:polysaccharide deacetylase family protein [Pseudonocardia halophobica]|uniref:Polysaccharide deacetylase n=1 Tax=Pseudonocardia halophobica TaxID=29401 RepID=A0A9W6L7S1_9PSEU|nr:polysaccharide deacetylase family protein [Pseudonocardia halophobica]GLL14460.1 polysaccharide deacetylase [Pseudonocardia halophobica]